MHGQTIQLEKLAVDLSTQKVGNTLPAVVFCVNAPLAVVFEPQRKQTMIIGKSNWSCLLLL